MLPHRSAFSPSQAGGSSLRLEIGKAAIRDYFTKDIASSKAAGAVVVINPKTDVGVSGNRGWESGAYKVTVQGAIVETGKFLSVSRKKDGDWLHLRERPPAAVAQLSWRRR